MATSDPYLSRREGIGLGIGATPETVVAPQLWLKWLDQDIQPKTEIIENESALGVVEKINDSEVVAKWVEGTIGGKVTEQGIGFMLLGLFGSVSSGSVVGGVFPHTFTVNQSSIPPAMTLAQVTPLTEKRHSYLTFDSLEINAEEKGWVQVSSAVKARVGETSSETIATLNDEKEFTSKHIVLKTAANTGGLAGADPIKTKSVKMQFERPSEMFLAHGSDDEVEFDRGVFEAKGEFVVRYMNTDLEEDYIANTIKALSLTMANGSTSLVFTASKVRFRELEKSTDRNQIVTQTVSFYCEFDSTVGHSVQAVLTNPRASYVAA